MPAELREEYLADVGRSEFAAHRYDLFRHNCNTFSAAFAEFLTGNTIPARPSSWQCCYLGYAPQTC